MNDRIKLSATTRWCATALAAGLLLLAGVVLPSTARLNFASAPAVPSPAIIYPDRVTQSPFEKFAELSKRPLFNADRKPDPAAPGASGDAQRPTIDSYRLAGIVTTGDTAVALVERKATQTLLHLKPGDTLDGRTVKQITATKVVFTGSPDETLEFPKLPGASITPATAVKEGQKSP